MNLKPRKILHGHKKITNTVSIINVGQSKSSRVQSNLGHFRTRADLNMKLLARNS